MRQFPKIEENKANTKNYIGTKIKSFENEIYKNGGKPTVRTRTRNIFSEIISTAPIIIDKLSPCVQAFDMPRILRVVAIGVLIILLKGEIIRNMFLKTKMV